MYTSFVAIDQEMSVGDYHDYVKALDDLAASERIQSRNPQAAKRLRHAAREALSSIERRYA